MPIFASNFIYSQSKDSISNLIQTKIFYLSLVSKIGQNIRFHKQDFLSSLMRQQHKNDWLISEQNLKQNRKIINTI